MSHENVKIVHAAIDAANRRDLPVLDALWSETSEFHSTFAATEGRLFRGRAGLREYFATLGDSFDHVWVVIEEITDAGEDRLVVRLRVTARGKRSGIPVEQTNGQVWTLRDQTVLQIVSYLDPAEALAAVGLSE